MLAESFTRPVRQAPRAFGFAVRLLRRMALPGLLLALTLSATAAITGSVENASNGKPVRGAAVTLVQLEGGMQPIAHTTTDASGKFQFSQTPPAGQPMMVQVQFQGVPYFQPLPPGQTSTSIQVYNASGDASQLQLDSVVMVLQPAGKWLAIIEQDDIQNQRKLSYYRKGGIFRFRVPKGVKPDGARVIGPSGMPIAQNPQPTGQPDVYSIDYPVRPGDNKFQLSYRLPYDTQKASLQIDPVFPVAHFEVYVPTQMSFHGDAFKLLGGQQGYDVYDVSGAKGPYTFSVSGTAPMPEIDTNGHLDNSGSGAAAQPQAPAAPAGDPDVGKVPAKTFMEKNLWVVAALLGMAATAGFGMLLARPRAQTAGTAPAPVAPATPAGPVLDDDMKKLKDDLFLLEVRRHTGNIDDAEYARLKQELDARMARLARG